MQAPLSVRLDPGDVIADSPNFPAFEPGRWDQHGEIRFAAGAGKRGRDVSFFTLWIFDADDQHVLGHPAFVTRNVGSDAQRKTFLAQQGVAAIARTVRPNL